MQDKPRFCSYIIVELNGTLLSFLPALPEKRKQLWSKLMQHIIASIHGTRSVYNQFAASGRTPPNIQKDMSPSYMVALK